MRRACAFGALAACAIALCWAAGPAHAGATVTLPLTVHVAQLDGQPVTPPEFIAERVARANQIFAPYGVAFEIKRERPLPARYAALEDRAARDALGAEVSGAGAIDCFVVGSLRDVDEPERMRRGVHWHSRTHPGKHFVIVSSIAGPDVLAHELGHFLGNAEHSETPGNLMSYQHGDALPFLDEAQLVRLRKALQHYLRSGELKPVRPR